MRRNNHSSACAMIFSCAVLAPGVAGVSGCSAFEKKKVPEARTSQVILERENDYLAMSPAEQDRMYRDSFRRGADLAERGQYGLAMGAFEEAVRIMPDSYEARFNLAACYDAIGDPMQAVSIYRELLSEAPDDADCYANLGTSFIKMYHQDNSAVWKRMAWEAWEESLRISPDQPAVRAYLARSKETR